MYAKWDVCDETDHLLGRCCSFISFWLKKYLPFFFFSRDLIGCLILVTTCDNQ